MKPRLLILVLVIVLMIIAIVIALNNREPELPWESSEHESPPHTEETEPQWENAERLFPSQPEEPLLLYADKLQHKSIYVQDGAIRFRTLVDTTYTGEALLDIEAPEGYYWRNGNTLLIGIPKEQSDPDNYLRGEWYAIDFGDTATIQPSILKLEDAFIDPAKLLTVSIVEHEQLFHLVVDLDNLRFNEYFYAAGESRLQYVNLEIPRNDESYYEEHYVNKRPQAAVDVQYFQKETPYPLADGSSIHGYEDDLGTLLVYHSGVDNYRYAIRYAGAKLIDVALKVDLLGNANPLIWTDGPVPSMSYPVIGNSTSIQPTEELLSDEWKMVTMRHFYQLDGNTLSTIRFEDNVQGSLYSNPERKTYELPGQPVDDLHGLLNLETNGVQRYLSVFDLLHGRGQLDDLWSEALPVFLTAEVGERATEEWEILNEAALPEEILELIWTKEEWPLDVTEAADPSDYDCIIDCGGDFYNVPQIRSIEGTSYILVGQNFYHVKDGKISILGQFPVTNAYTHGEGSNGYTALDYTRIGMDWYVADTYGDRVIKLDEKLVVLAEYKLPTPSRITISGENTIQVKSLQGITELDTQLNKLRDHVDQSIKIKSLKPSEQLFPDISHDIDKKSGIHWVYTGEGQLITYNPTAKEFKTTFIGYPESGRAIIRIIPYKDEVLVLMDYRLLRFSLDGKWKSTIDFSRGPRDAIYNKTPFGENSYVFDSMNGFIYIVQGVRVMAIDLANDSASTLFHQDYSDIGDLSLYKDRLMFSMEGNPFYTTQESTKNSNELIMINPQTGSIDRYLLERGWYSEGLDMQVADQFNFWSFQDLDNRAWDSIHRATLPLAGLF